MMAVWLLNGVGRRDGGRRSLIMGGNSPRRLSPRQGSYHLRVRKQSAPPGLRSRKRRFSDNSHRFTTAELLPAPIDHGFPAAIRQMHVNLPSPEIEATNRDGETRRRLRPNPQAAVDSWRQTDHAEQ